MAGIGMAVPGSMPGASDLGLGGTSGDAETEDERRKRLLAMQQQRLLPNTNAVASQLMGGYGAGLPTS